MFSFTFIFTLVLASLQASANLNFSDSLTKCSEENHHSLDFCMVNLIDEMRPLFFKGIPDLAIPILEPMSISNITLDVTDASFVAILSNLQIRGLSKFITKSVTYESMQRSKLYQDILHPDKMQMKLTLGFPEFRATGQYRITGKVFALPIEGSGPFWAIISNVSAEAVQSLGIKENSNKGIKQLEIVDQHFELTFEKMRMRLNNLFNGDPVIGEIINTFLNENQKELFNYYKEDIFKQIGQLTKTIINEGLKNFPADIFLKLIKQ